MTGASLVPGIYVYDYDYICSHLHNNCLRKIFQNESRLATICITWYIFRSPEMKATIYIYSQMHQFSPILLLESIFDYPQLIHIINICHNPNLL